MTNNQPTPQSELDRLLLIAAESLDLPPGKHKDATDKYEAVGRYLAENDSPLKIYSPQVYPHGSFALGTIVKPLGRDEFDIDLMCVLDVPNSVTQKQLKQLVGDRLKIRYRAPMLEEKNRCWRIHYAGDFHLDITPAKPHKRGPTTTALHISDKEYLFWKDTDPKGFIGWFEYRKIVTALFAINGAQASVKPAPTPEEQAQKAPLQIAIQLLKRHRDIQFQNRDDAPISIIITTLAGHAYQQEQSVSLTMRALIERMPEHIDKSKGYAYIPNPTNAGENFADKWRANPKLESAFCEWIDQASKDISLLESRSIANMGAVLNRFLGEKRSKIVLEKWAQPIIQARPKNLFIDGATGALGASGIAVPRNSNFGN
jgi:hypothetical protein